MVYTLGKTHGFFLNEKVMSGYICGEKHPEISILKIRTACYSGELSIDGHEKTLKLL